MFCPVKTYLGILEIITHHFNLIFGLCIFFDATFRYPKRMLRIMKRIIWNFISPWSCVKCGL